MEAEYYTSAIVLATALTKPSFLTELKILFDQRYENTLSHKKIQVSKKINIIVPYE